MSKLTLKIGHLYGDSMNTYGDDGNILVLKKRCQWRDIQAEVINIPIGYAIKPKEFDLYFFGGGQDQAQVEVGRDLVSKNKGLVLKDELERGVPLLSICGGYQLLGDYYKPHQGPKIEGLGLFPAYTNASFDRMIGNIIINSQLSTLNSEFLVGFENHSGKTYLKEGASPLGIVERGFGNNGEDSTEGCVYKNSIGCYMHGPLLPKNPCLADWLIQKALEVKYGKEIDLKPLDDTLEFKTHKTAIDKFS